MEPYTLIQFAVFRFFFILFFRVRPITKLDAKFQIFKLTKSSIGF